VSEGRFRGEAVDVLSGGNEQGGGVAGTDPELGHGGGCCFVDEGISLGGDGVDLSGHCLDATSDAAEGGFGCLGRIGQVGAGS
jgi:hypothetical protein